MQTLRYFFYKNVFQIYAANSHNSEVPAGTFPRKFTAFFPTIPLITLPCFSLFNCKKSYIMFEFFSDTLVHMQSEVFKFLSKKV